MNKKVLLALLVSLGLAACAPANGSSNTSSSNNPSDSSDTSSDTSSSTTDTNPDESIAPKTVRDLYSFIKSTSLSLDIIYGKTAERNTVVGQAHLFYDSFETSKEVYHSYSDDVLTVSGETRYQEVPIDEWGTPVDKTDTFEGISAKVDNLFYQIIDYKDESINPDSANRYVVPSEVSENTVDMFTTTGISLMLYTHFDNYIMKNIVEGADAITPVIDGNGDFSYKYQLAFNTPMDYETISTVIDLDVAFTKEGMIKSYHFKAVENSITEDYEGNTVTKLASSIDDTFTVTDLGEKGPHEEFNINPLDYYLVSYDIQLFLDDMMGGEDSLTEADPNAIPLGSNLAGKVINPQPSKALDTDIDFIESSNPEVVKVTTYDGYKSSVKAVGLGQATLTAISESGITQTIDVTVVTLPLESIKVSIYDSSIVEGDEVTVYVSRNPDSNTDELEATLSCGSDVATVTKDGEYFQINTFKAAENVTLTVYSKQNPDVKTEVTFTIHKKYTFDEIKEAIKDSVWVSNYKESSATIAFNADGTGYFMVTNNTSYGSIFTENQKYNFTYTIEEHEDGYPGDVTLTLSSFVVTSGGSDFNFNENIVVLDYSMSSLDVRLTPEGETGWFYAFSDDFFLQK